MHKCSMCGYEDPTDAPACSRCSWYNPTQKFLDLNKARKAGVLEESSGNKDVAGVGTTATQMLAAVNTIKNCVVFITVLVLVGILGEVITMFSKLLH